MTPYSRQRGFIGRVLVFGLIILVGASLAGIDLKKFVESPVTQRNFGYVVELGKWTWTYVKPTVAIFWNQAVLSGFRDAATRNIEILKDARVGKFDAQNLFPVLPQDFLPQMPRPECVPGGDTVLC